MTYSPSRGSPRLNHRAVGGKVVVLGRPHQVLPHHVSLVEDVEGEGLVPGPGVEGKPVWRLAISHLEPGKGLVDNQVCFVIDRLH